MKLTVLGSYPRVPESSGPSVRTALNGFDRGQVTPRELEDTFQAVTRRVLALAAQYGLTTTTDGQVRWYDATDPVVRDTENLVAGGLTRYFNNNFYYRQPVVRGRLSWNGGTLLAWTRVALGLGSAVPLKAVIPGPLTLAALSEDASYHHRGRLLKDLVEVLRLEADSLRDTGIVEIQWDEPALAVQAAQDPDEAAAVLGDLFQGAGTCPESLALYFGGTTRWLPLLRKIGVSRVYADLVADPGLATLWAEEREPFEVGLGLLNAREVRLESVEDVASPLEPVLRCQGEDRVWLHPSAGLEWLPPDWAKKKLQRLQAVRSHIRGTGHIDGEGEGERKNA